EGLRHSVPVTLTEDAHIIVVATGQHEPQNPKLTSPRRQVPPFAVTNPIFVDIDGNGLVPNKDTLGEPLPVARPDRSRWLPVHVIARRSFVLRFAGDEFHRRFGSSDGDDLRLARVVTTNEFQTAEYRHYSGRRPGLWRHRWNIRWHGANP